MAKKSKISTARDKLQSLIEETGDYSLIIAFTKCKKSFDFIQQLIEDSSLTKQRKKGLKSIARDAYPWYALNIPLMHDCIKGIYFS